MRKLTVAVIAVVAAIFTCVFMMSAARADEAAPDVEWQKRLGGSLDDGAFSIRQTNDGSYIFAGGTYSNDGDVSGNHGGQDAWIVKLNASGELEWQKCLGGSGNDFANSILHTSDGGYIFAGFTQSNDGDVSGNNGGQDAWIVKLNASGETEWQKCLGGSDNDEALSIQQTSDGGYIFAGFTQSNDGDVSGNHGGQDAWVVKLNASGEIVWQRCFGGSGDDMAFSIQLTNDGGYILAGNTDSNDGDVSGNHSGNYGGRDVWIVKLNSSGEKEWQKCLGGFYDDGDVSSIQQTNDGGYIFAGATQSNDGDVSGNNGGWDTWIVKLNELGEMVWQKCLGGSDDDAAIIIQLTSDGGYIFAGFTQSNDGDVSGNHVGRDAWIVKLNASGETEWQRCSGRFDDDVALSIQQTSDGGYVFAGWTYFKGGDVLNRDAWIVKLAPDGR